MEAIFALILAGAIVRTAGMWAVTRLAVMATVLYAIFLDFTPLRLTLEPAARWVWIAMLVLWLANLVAPRRTASV